MGSSVVKWRLRMQFRTKRIESNKKCTTQALCFNMEIKPGREQDSDGFESRAQISNPRIHDAINGH